MAERIGFMFAGQGAQAVGMGRDLYQASGAARAIFEQANDTLKLDLTRLCFEGPAEALTQSRVCQPAIYTMSMACLAALREALPVQPVICGGLSLGEFAALTAAGVLDFESGLKLVAERGRLMEEACRASEGAMAAVLNAPSDQVDSICAANGVDVANYNCPGQLVISGEKNRIAQTVDALKEAGISKVIPLQVDGAFHSRLMEPAGRKFAEVLAATKLNAPTCLVVQNVVGKLVETPEDIAANLGSQVSGSVKWEQCVQAMLDQKLDLLIELGPGKVLSGFMRRIDRRFPVCNVAEVADLEGATALIRG